MAFRFSLSTLLRLREIAEQREERLLGQIERQIAQSRKTLADLISQRETETRRREDALRESTFAVALIDSHLGVRAIRSLEADAREQIAKLANLREQQMNIYQTARRDCEVLSDMRDDRRDEFFKERLKQEQSAMDDNFSSRRRLN